MHGAGSQKIFLQKEKEFIINLLKKIYIIIELFTFIMGGKGSMKGHKKTLNFKSIILLAMNNYLNTFLSLLTYFKQRIKIIKQNYKVNNLRQH